MVCLWTDLQRAGAQEVLESLRGISTALALRSLGGIDAGQANAHLLTVGCDDADGVATANGNQAGWRC